MSFEKTIHKGLETEESEDTKVYEDDAREVDGETGGAEEAGDDPDIAA